MRDCISYKKNEVNLKKYFYISLNIMQKMLSEKVTFT